MHNRLSARPEIDDLAALLPGQVTRPGDADYDTLRAIKFDPENSHPAALVRVASAEDIARTITFARQHAFELAVRSGGHSASGHSSVEGGIVIDLRGLDAVDVDAAGKTVWVGGGATAGAVLRALEPHELVVGFGDSGDVGVGGIVSGGGLGYLSRLYGTSADAMLAAEVVLADGRIVTASSDSEPELFWAIRGGGGNFGVLSRIRFQAQELREFTGGMMVLPATPAVITGFVAAAQAAPDALGSIAMVLPAPPAPFIPEAHRNSLVLFAFMAFPGSDAEAEKALAPFRALATPLFDAVKPGPFLSLYEGEGGSPPGLPELRTLFVDRIGEDAAQTIAGFLTESDSPMRAVQIRVLGGAINRVGVRDTAYAHRNSQIMLNLINFYADETDRPRRRKWVEDLMAALRQGDEGAYVNFLGPESPQRVRAAYPGATWDRLRQIKRRYDPENVFRRNQNIPPAA